MATVEVSRTLVKSPPELWAELERGERLTEVVGPVALRATEPERQLTWEGTGTRGRIALEPAGWGTRVTLSAELEREAAEQGRWGRVLRRRGPHPVFPDRRRQLERRLETLLDDLGAAHRKPFAATGRD